MGLYSRYAGLMAGAALAGVQPALAQDAQRTGEAAASDSPPEIIVTATKREQRLIDVPIAITALNEDTLARINADRFQDYVRTVPGLVYNQSGANSGSFAIRGIATGSLAGNTQSPVAIYIDDLPTLDMFAPLITPDLRLFDVGRVEVLRGPQGTLFGSGAAGGAIRIITNKPNAAAFDARGEATAEATRRGDMSLGGNAMINIPLVADKLAVRAVGYARRDGGHVDNAARGDRNVERQTSIGGRLMLKWQATPEFSLMGTISYQRDRPRDSNFSDYDAPGYSYSGAVAQPVRTKSTIYNLVAEYALPAITITASTTYNDRSDLAIRDFTRRLDPLLSDLGVSGPYPAQVFGTSKSFAQEIRIASRGPSALQWLIGGIYLNTDRDSNELIHVPGAGAILAPIGFPSDDLLRSGSVIKAREAALFGEISYTIADRLTATAGLRYFRDRIRLAGTADGLINGGPTAITRRQSESAATPKFALSYRIGDDARIYAQVAKGYRVGQNNLTPLTDPTDGAEIPGAYDADTLWNYEVGVKGRWLDGALSASAALFAIDFRNIQLQARSATGFAYIANAGDARSRGGELELTLRPAPGFEAGTALAYTATRLAAVAPGVDALVGDRLPGTPRFTASNYLQFETAIAGDANAYLRGEHQYFGKAFSDLNNPAALTYGDYHILNLRAGVDFGRFGVALHVNNLTDSRAIQNAFRLPGGSTAIRLRPRTFGLTLRAGF